MTDGRLNPTKFHPSFVSCFCSFVPSQLLFSVSRGSGVKWTDSGLSGIDCAIFSLALRARIYFRLPFFCSFYSFGMRKKVQYKVTRALHNTLLRISSLRAIWNELFENPINQANLMDDRVLQRRKPITNLLLSVSDPFCSYPSLMCKPIFNQRREDPINPTRSLRRESSDNAEVQP